MSPSPKLELRPLSAVDAAWLESLHAECFDEIRRWSAALLSQFLSNAFSYGAALTVDDEPAGFILGQSADDSAEIVTLAVLPAHARKGYALSLVKNFADHMQNAGKTRLLLEVAENNLAAIRLYEKAGFAKQGIRPKYYRQGSDSLDAVIMQKLLNR